MSKYVLMWKIYHYAKQKNKTKQNKTKQNKTKKPKKQKNKNKKQTKKKIYISKLAHAFVFRCAFDLAKFKFLNVFFF